MQPFADVGNGRRDPEVLRERLRSDGYVFLQGLLPPTDVEAVYQDVARALSDAGWLAPGTDALGALPGGEPRHEATDAFWPGYTAVQQLESFHRLAHHSALHDVVAAIMDGDVLVHPRKIARATFPQDVEYTTPPHQDFRTIQGSADVLTIWVPLTDCPRELGGLKVLAGPLDRLLPVTPAKGAGGMTTGVSDDEPTWRWAPYRRGDVLVFHSLTVHGALPNVSDRVRLSVDYRYQRLDDPVTELSLLPHHHPDVPGWDELARGWDSTEWVTTPTAVSTVDVAPYGGDIAVPPSRLVPVAG